MNVDYGIKRHKARWVIQRILTNDSYRDVDYYRGIDAPWGPYCFGKFIDSAMGFRWRWQASRALKKYVAYRSNASIQAEARSDDRF